MKDTTQTAGQPSPPVVSNPTGTGSKGPKQKTTQEMEFTLPNPDKSPPRKKKTPSEASSLHSANSFEATAAGASRDVSVLAATFAEVLSERASADTSQMKELEGILTEARNLESFLKEKKSHLRQTLALISDKLQG